MNMVRKDADLAAEPAGPRTLRFTISTADVDSEHDRIAVDGWDLSEFNGTVLWGHDHHLPAIARAIQTGVVGRALKSTAEFPPPGLYPLADTVYGLTRAGFLSGKASVGFTPGKWRHNDLGGVDFEEGHKLLEWSVVNLPANRNATLDAARRGFDAGAVRKWLRQGGLAPVPGCLRGDRCAGSGPSPDTCRADDCPMRHPPGPRASRVPAGYRDPADFYARTEPVSWHADETLIIDDEILTAGAAPARDAYTAAVDDFQRRQQWRALDPSMRRALRQRLSEAAAFERWAARQS